MKLIKPIILLSLLLTTTAYSDTQSLNDNKLLTMTIAKDAPTRLVLEQEKIADVFFYPEEAAKVILHQSGAVFVVPMKDQTHVYLTLMGENGSTQDCALTFAEKAPEPVKFIEEKTLTMKPIINNQKDKTE